MSFNAESEFGINFVSGSTVTTSLVLMSRTDFENSREVLASSSFEHYKHIRDFLYRIDIYLYHSYFWMIRPVLPGFLFKD